MAGLRMLFSKVKIGSMELKNRICMGEIGAEADENGYIAQRLIDFYVERARGGAGLIMIGGTCPDISGIGGKRFARIDNDKYIPRLAEAARRIHDASPDVKVGIQLWHVGRQMHTEAEGAMPGITPVAPSPIKYQFGTVPHELTTEEVEALVKKYVEAARRAKEAGFDIVNLHGAHGYFISQFLSPYTNKRTDKYGGSVENRARFSCEIIQGIKKKCGKDFPVSIKINGEDFVTSEPQIHIEHTKAIAPLLEKAGVDEIHLSGGTHESTGPVAVGPYMVPKGAYVKFSEEVKKMVKIPVGAVNRINDPVLAEQILELRKADLIWMTRALIADPELPNKAKEGNLDEIRYCIACNNCIDRIWAGWHGDSMCTVNAEAWREGQLRIEPTIRPKKVLVIGGGPGGMEAARVARLIGHEVTLWEKEDKLGGQVNLSAVVPDKEEFGNIIRYFTAQFKRLGVKVELKKEATRASVEGVKPNAVIIATGSTPLIIPIPGVEGKKVVTARDVLAGKAEVSSRVVVVGGGEVGMETAEFLAQKGKKIVLLEMLPKLGEGMVRMVLHYVLGKLAKSGVEMLTRTKVEEINEKGVVVIDKEQRKRTIEADSVILATGAKANNSLQQALQGVVKEIYVVGDCLYAGSIKGAIYQGAVVARMLEERIADYR